MDTVSLNPTDFSPDERRIVESMVGRPLADDEEVTLGVGRAAPSRECPPESGSTPPQATELPEYYHVYDGLTDEQIEQLEAVVLQRANLTRLI